MKNRLLQVWEKLGVRYKKRSVILICCLLLVMAASCVMAAYFTRSSKEETVSNEDRKNTAQRKEGISAAGYISYGSLPMTFDLTMSYAGSTAELEVEKVYVSAGDTIEEGDDLLKVTDDSLSKAKILMDKALESAQSDLVKEQLSYSTSKLEAEYAYLEDSGMDETAKAQYQMDLDKQQTKVDEANEQAAKAQETIDQNTANIGTNQKEIEELNSQIASLAAELSEAESKSEEAEIVYEEARAHYQPVISELETILTVKKYVLEYQNQDTSEFEDFYQEIKEEVVSLGANDTETQTSEYSKMTEPSVMPTASSGSGGTDKAIALSSEAVITSENDTLAAVSNDTSITEMLNQLTGKNTQLMLSYEKTKDAYTTAKSLRDSMKKTISENTAEISEAEKNAAELEKENNQLDQELEKAQSQLPSLQLACTEAINSQIMEIANIKLEYKSQMAEFESAQNTYEITIASLDEELNTYETAKANVQETVDALTAMFTDGVLKADQSGLLQSADYKEGDILTAQMPIMVLRDRDTRTITISVDQKDITSVSIGDTAVILSTDYGQFNGSVAAVTSSAEPANLSNVTYEVTISIEENTQEWEDNAEATVYLNMGELVSQAAPATSNLKNSESQEEQGE